MTTSPDSGDDADTPADRAPARGACPVKRRWPARGAARAAGLMLALSLLAEARPLVGGVLLAVPDDDVAALAPLLAALR